MTEKFTAARIELNDVTAATNAQAARAAQQSAAGEVDPEYADLVKQTAKDNAKMAQRIMQPQQLKQCDDPDVAGDDTVPIIVPKTFNLTEQDRSQVEFKQGVRIVSRRHAEHWWVIAHGCTNAGK